MERTRKFNKNSNLTLNELCTTFVYKFREKLNKGEKLTSTDKQWITDNVQDNVCGRKTEICLFGYAFDFSDILQRYVVCIYGQWQEKYAANKTCLRKTLGGGVSEIVQIPKK